MDRLLAEPLYAEAVLDIVRRVAEAKFIPFLVNESMQGLHFNIEGTKELQVGAVWATPDTTIEKMAEGVLWLSGFGAWNDRLRQDFFERGLIEPEAGCGRYPNGAVTVALTKQLMQECLEKSTAKLVAAGLMKQSKAAIADGAILRHNRQVHAEKLRWPLQKALWDGVTPEEILAWARNVQASGSKTPPTLKEALESIKRKP
jgi:hypothetical protein